MSRGIVIVAFGKEYEKLAAHVVAKSIPFIPCPMTVLVNVENCLCLSEKWQEVKGVDFKYLNLHDDENRAVRTQLVNYTPYDETLYVDCDAIFVKPGIEKIFDLLADNDAVFQQCHEWRPGKPYYQIYRDAVKILGAELPLKIFNGGIFAFKKDEAVQNFFHIWNEYWRYQGVGRDMPALACAIQRSGIKHATITKDKDKFFSFGMDSDAIILHRVRPNDLHKFFDIPQHKHNIDYDRKNPWFWNRVYLEESQNELINHPWIKQKFDRTRRIAEKHAYIEKYLPEMMTGGLSVLDVATGPGEFLELAQELECDAIGIDGFARMLDRPIDKLYNQFSKLKIKEKNLPVIEADMNEVIKNDHPGLADKKFDIINCQLAINFIASAHFNSHAELGEYKNNGEWIFSEGFTDFFHSYFTWCKKHLHKNGIVMIAALTALNRVEYSKRIFEIAEYEGFDCEISDNNLNHKFVVQNG